jgi:aryl-alcohol dehydrogenase-like predicted oxidoreductase
MWQVSGAHGKIDSPKAICAMFEYMDAGFTTWDLADHYGPAEDFIREFRRQLQVQRGETAPSKLQILTRWAPYPERMTRQIVEDNINALLHRIGADCLDVLQFHWWKYRDRNYIDALKYLMELQAEGKVRNLALTNFDTEHLQIVLDQGVKIVSHQVQYSLIDRRPEVAMIALCKQHDIKILAYGSLCGGLLSDRYLKQPEPEWSDLNTASLRKYKQMVTLWGGWALLQELLTGLSTIAQKHQVSIANIALRYVLERPVVGGVIIGVRLGRSKHIQDNARVFNFELDEADYQQIESILNQSRNLYKWIGDCGIEYRR